MKEISEVAISVGKETDQLALSFFCIYKINRFWSCGLNVIKSSINIFLYVISVSISGLFILHVSFKCRRYMNVGRFLGKEKDFSYIIL